MAILLYLLLVILGASAEITSGATFAIPAFALCFADCVNAVRVNDLNTGCHVSLLDSLNDHNRDSRHIGFVRQLASFEVGAHLARSKLILARMAEFNERAILKLFQNGGAKEQLAAVRAGPKLVRGSML